MSLVINDVSYYESVLNFAIKIGKIDDLQRNLKILENYGENTRCILHKDFAPYSFYFVMEAFINGEWKRYFNGGLIFHGPHDHGGDGGAPTFSVSLNPVHGWSIHT